MPYNGSGGFNRVFSWVADKAAGLDISSSRMDTDSNDLASNGLGAVLTRDGQGSASANLPMNTFRHTGVGNAVNRTDYAALGQAQDGLIEWTIAGGSADAITATYTPSQGAPVDGQIYWFRATAANATTTPTFAPNSQTARTITKGGGTALVPGDIPGNLAEVCLRYNSANTRYELLNPAVPAGVVGTGDVKLTIKTSADSGWLLFDDGTFGSASSGSSNSASAANQSLFTLFFNNMSDTAAPLLTSGGGATTRAGQGTAAAAWTANCRMTLNKTLGRALAVSGAGSGLTSRALGATVGEETHLLTTAELAAHSHSNTLTDNGHTHGGVPSASNGNATGYPATGADIWHGSSISTGTNNQAPMSISNVNAGGGGAHNNMQPSSFFNIMIKQ